MIKKLHFLLFLLPVFSFADTINCKVVGVTDGDTITCLTDKKEQLKIRLYQIDAPEKKQAYGQKSKQLLSNLIFNKNVRIETHKKDKYKRTLGTIYINIPTPCPDKIPNDRCAECSKTIDVNLDMIKRGMAWYYPYSKKNKQYEHMEEYARTNKRGLWSQKAIAPWQFRKLKK